MISKISVAVLMVAALLSAGCQNSPNRVGEGALIGGVLGAGAGGIIGQQSHHGGEGAAIGAVAGILGGAIVGSQIQKPQQGAATGNPASNPNQMSIQQVIDLSKQGVNDAVIIDKIHLTNSKFSLSAGDLDYLKQQGVHQQVIDAMQGLR
jgi:hypothetical protein